MIEENKEVSAVEQQETSKEAPKEHEIQSLAKTELSIEDQARLQGWRPKEDFGGDPAEWKDAKHFLEIGESWRKQAALSKELKELREQFKHLVEGQAQLQKMEYERAYNDILAAKARLAASPNPNLAEYDQLKEKEFELKQSANKHSVPVVDPGVEAIKNTGAWAKFNMLNPWFNKNDADSQYLRAKAVEFAADFPLPKNEEDVDKQLTALHNKMRQEYGYLINKTSPQVRPRVMPVTDSGTKAGEESNYDYLHVGHQEAIKYLKSKNDTPENIQKSVEAYLKSIKQK